MNELIIFGFLLMLSFSISGACPILSTPMNAEETLITNTTVEYQCKTGFIISSGSLYRDCDNNTWTGSPPICIIITCDAPTIGPFIIVNSTSYGTYGDVIEYTCINGHLLLNGLTKDQSVCSLDGRWSIPYNLTELRCYRDSTYIGCFKNYEPSTDEYIEAVSSFSICKSVCKERQFRFLILSNTSCICSNADISNELVVGDQMCNNTCPVHGGNAQCGGYFGEVGVFTTIRGGICVDTTNITFTTELNIYGIAKRTCTQKCLALNSTYALLNSNTSLCRCVDKHFVEVTSLESKLCTESSQYSTIYNLALFAPLAQSCEDLYNTWEIRDSGYYRLKDHNSYTLCNFLDGTECDEGWIGFSGSCYKIITDVENFTMAGAYCAELNSHLVSIGHRDENFFLRDTLRDFTEYSTIDNIFIGFTDPQDANAYSWTDGALETFTNFRDAIGVQSNDVLLCIMMDMTKNGDWLRADCSWELSFICERPKEPPRCLSVVSQPNVYQMSNQDMSLSMCIQQCKGKGASFALIQYDQCICNDTLNVAAQYSMLNCSSTCSGNIYQHCGNQYMDLYTVKIVNEFSAAQSCSDLAVQGIHGIEAELTSGYEKCNDTGCPFSWIRSGRSCLKFVTRKASFANAYYWCSSHGGHLAVPNTRDENEILTAAIATIPSLMIEDTYIIGFKGTSSNSDIYRTVTGEMFPSFQQPISVSEDHSLLGLYVNGTWMTLSGMDVQQYFICEISEAYVGCFYKGSVTAVSSVVMAVSDYSEMTIEFCVEVCRELGQAYALLTSSTCECSSNVPLFSDDGAACNEYCAGSKGQLCGSNAENTVSAYDIGAYPEYESCEELYEAGFRRSGEYRLLNGTTTCNFYDNSTRCPEDWIAYNENCYRLLMGTFHTGDDITQKCTNHNATEATILDDQMLTVIANYMMGSEHTSVDKVIIGLEDAWGMDIPNWPDGKVLNHSNVEYSKNYNYIKMFNALERERGYMRYSDVKSTNYEVEINGVLCQKENEEWKGCFQYPHSISSQMISNSMELTQCRQLCMGLAEKFAILNNKECFCGDDVVLSTLLSVDDITCNEPCLHHRQKCGGSTVVNVYELGYEDIASSCKTLSKYGIFYNATYAVNINGEIKIQTCGFTDDTLCRQQWFGHHGKCYHFYHGWNPDDSACLKINGYQATPATNDDVNFLINAISQMEQFDDSELFRIFPYNRFLNRKFLTGDGHFLRNSIDASDANAFNFEKNTGNWESASGKAYVHICERSEGFIGCVRDTHNNNAEYEFTMTEATSTQCIQFCMGRNNSYAGVQDLKCFCYNMLSLIDDDDDDIICSSCSGYPKQACGSVDETSIALFDLEYYQEDLSTSCDELYSYGVIKEGVYIIRPEGANLTIFTTCFDTDPSLKTIPISDIQVDVSSAQEGFHASWLKINPYPVSSEVWIPSDISNPHITFSFQDDYLITGVATQGRLEVGVEQWTSAYRLKYMNEFGEMQEWNSNMFDGEIPGNVNNYSIVTHYLSAPIVTKQLELWPTNWTDQPAMHVDILGQHFSYFNHTATSLGRFYDIETSPDVVFTIQNQSSCRLHCMDVGFAFYSYKGIKCYCSSSIGKYGKVVNEKNETDFPNVEYYRTYDLSCKSPHSVNRAYMTYAFPHAADVYTVTSFVTFDCEEGYEFPDGERSKYLTCLLNNTWSAVLEDCQLLYCYINLSIVHGVLSSTSAQFNNTLTMTCNIGYVHAGNMESKTFLCSGDGTWNDTVEDCMIRSCPAPSAFMNGEITGDVYTVNETLHYQCVPHTHISTNVYNTSVKCGADGQWSPLPPQECVVYECLSDPPVIPNGIVQRLDMTTAQYSCGPFYVLSTGRPTENITCDVHMTWTPTNFSCKENGTLQKQAEYRVAGQLERMDTSDLLPSEYSYKSLFDCADRCLKHYACVAYNFHRLTKACKLFSSLLSTSSTRADLEWKYFEIQNFIFS